MYAIERNHDFILPLQSVCLTKFQCETCDRERWHSQGLSKISKLVRKLDPISRLGTWNPFSDIRGKWPSDLCWAHSVAAERVWLWHSCTIKRFGTSLTLSQQTQNKHTSILTHKELWPQPLFFLCNSLVTLVFRCLFLSFLTAHWWMFSLCITSLQCLCKALLLILCCFNLLARRSHSALCQGSLWVMRRRLRWRCNDVLLLMWPISPCLFVGAHTITTVFSGV